MKECSVVQLVDELNNFRNLTRWRASFLQSFPLEDVHACITGFALQTWIQRVVLSVGLLALHKC